VYWVPAGSTDQEDATAGVPDPVGDSAVRPSYRSCSTWMEKVSAAAAGSREERSPERPRRKRTAPASGPEWRPQPTNKMKTVNPADKKHACFRPWSAHLMGPLAVGARLERRYLRIVCRGSALIGGFPSGEAP